MSRRKLARMADIPETTLASIFTRRPKQFPQKYLEKIADVLEVPLFYLQEEPNTEHPDEYNDVDDVISFVRSQHPYAGLFFSNPTAVKDIAQHVFGMSNAERENIPRDLYIKASSILMLENLNEQGAFEALAFITSLAQNPQYKKTQEVTPWPEDAPPTAAEPNPGSDQTAAGK